MDKKVKVWALTGEGSAECAASLPRRPHQQYRLFCVVVAGGVFVAERPQLIAWGRRS